MCRSSAEPAPVPAVQRGPAVDAELLSVRDRPADASRCRTARKVFAGQRAEGFYVDLGSIFDLGCAPPDSVVAHLIPIPDVVLGVNATKDLNVHTIALQLPKKQLTHGDMPTDDEGIPFSGDRRVDDGGRRSAFAYFNHGATTAQPGEPRTVRPQVSRLGNPLFNEVLVPMERKDDWNAGPADERRANTPTACCTRSCPVAARPLSGMFPKLADSGQLPGKRRDLAAVC